MYTSNFDQKKGEIILPELFSKVLSSDGQVELTTCTQSRKLVLKREDDVVGQKRLIFAIDLEYKHGTFKNREAMRQVLIEFFKVYLGFSD